MNSLFLSLFFAKNLLKNRATNILAILALTSIVLSLALSDTNIVVKHKLFEDILLSSQAFMLHLSALFYTFEILSRDRSSGLFILPLSAGVSRERYLLSLFLSPLFAVFVVFVVFVVLDIISIFVVEGVFRGEVILQIFLYLLSCALFVFFMVFFSLFVSIPNALIYALLVLLIGNGLDELVVFASSSQESLTLLSNILFFLFPNFSFFDFQSEVVNKIPIELDSILFSMIYFVALSLIIYGISIIKYRKKILDVGY